MKEIELLEIIFKDSPDIFKIIKEIENQFQQKENIIKEIREYIEHSQNYGIKKNIYINGNDILEILDKGE